MITSTNSIFKILPYFFVFDKSPKMYKETTYQTRKGRFNDRERKLTHFLHQYFKTMQFKNKTVTCTSSTDAISPSMVPKSFEIVRFNPV